MTTKLNKLIHRIVADIARNIWLWVLLLVLSSIVSVLYVKSLSADIVVSIQVQGKFLVALKSILSATLYATFFYIVYILLRCSRFYRLLLLIVYITIYFAEFIIFNVYGMTFNSSTIGAALSSNPGETESFFRILLSPEYLTAPTLTLIFLGIGCWVVYRLGRRQTNIFYQSGVTVSILILSLGGLSSSFGMLKRYQKNIRLYEAAAPLERLFLGFTEYSSELKKIRQSRKQLLARASDLRSLPASEQSPDNVVLIIGESTTRGFMHCYGYPLENTPRLDSLIALGNLFLLDSVVSPAAATRESITASLTMHIPEEGKNWYDYPSLPSILMQAGYRSWWLSNQEKQGQVEISTIAETTDEQCYVSVQSTNHNIGAKHRSYDEAILPYLKSKAKSGGKRIFQIVHLMGTHTLFNERFPETYKHFTPNDIPKNKEFGKRQILADYANAILYNDYIVCEIIRHYEQEASIVIYISDHGQGLYQDPQAPNVFGHLFSEYSLQIPMMIYISPSMCSRTPKLKEQLARARSKRYMTDLISHTICGLLGIQTIYSNPKYELFSPEYMDTRPRIIRSPQGTIRL